MYQIEWTETAEEELLDTISYLLNDFTLKEVLLLEAEISHITGIISDNPLTFRLMEDSMTLRYVVVLTFNTLYYRVDNDKKLVTILTFFSNRQNPKNRKL